MVKVLSGVLLAVALGIYQAAVGLATGGLQAAQTGPAMPPPRAGDGLACVQEALGGARAFAAVSSLQFVGSTKPAATSGPRPVAGPRVISVVFPDHYKRLDGGQSGNPGVGELGATVGFSGATLLSSPRFPDTAASMLAARTDFAREMLMRFPRASKDVQVRSEAISDSGDERLALVAIGPGGTKTTLLADRQTCVPIAAVYLLRGPAGQTTVRVDLSRYAVFGGIRFPTRLRTSFNAQPFRDEDVSKVQVNPPAGSLFASMR